MIELHINLYLLRKMAWMQSCINACPGKDHYTFIFHPKTFARIDEICKNDADAAKFVEQWKSQHNAKIIPLKMVEDKKSFFKKLWFIEMSDFDKSVNHASKGTLP